MFAALVSYIADGGSDLVEALVVGDSFLGNASRVGDALLECSAPKVTTVLTVELVV